MSARQPREAPVTRYIAPTARHGGLIEVQCPYCFVMKRRRPTTTPSTHLHGASGAGAPSNLGHRVAHCVKAAPLEGYFITDPDGLVPEVNPAPKAVTA